MSLGEWERRIALEAARPKGMCFGAGRRNGSNPRSFLLELPLPRGKRREPCGAPDREPRTRLSIQSSRLARVSGISKARGRKGGKIISDVIEGDPRSNRTPIRGCRVSRGGHRPRFGLWVNKRKKKIFVRRVYRHRCCRERARAPTRSLARSLVRRSPVVIVPSPCRRRRRCRCPPSVLAGPRRAERAKIATRGGEVNAVTRRSRAFTTAETGTNLEGA